MRKLITRILNYNELRSEYVIVEFFAEKVYKFTKTVTTLSDTYPNKKFRTSHPISTEDLACEAGRRELQKFLADDAGKKIKLFIGGKSKKIKNHKKGKLHQ